VELNSCFQKKKLKEEKVKQLTTAATGATPWRPPNVSYSKNQLWVNVTEKVNAIFSTEGTLLKSDVEGIVQIKCELTGMPTCELAINDKLRIEGKTNSFEMQDLAPVEKKSGKTKQQKESITFADMNFHQCVRLQQFESDRVVSFVPPDGEFVLMKYRTPDVSPPFKISVFIKEVNQNRLGFNIHVVSLYDSAIVGSNVTVFFTYTI